MKQEQEKAALAIEKANRRRPAVGGIRTAAVASAGTGQPKKQLKFNSNKAAASGSDLG